AHVCSADRPSRIGSARREHHPLGRRPSMAGHGSLSCRFRDTGGVVGVTVSAREVVVPDFLFVIWEGEGVATSEDRRKEAMDLMGTYVMELLGKGKLKGGGPLYSPSEGKTAKGKNG